MLGDKSDQENPLSMHSLCNPSLFKKNYSFTWLCQVIAAAGWMAWEFLVEACGIHFPDQVEAGSPGLGAWNPGHWTTRKVPSLFVPSPNVKIQGVNSSLGISEVTLVRVQG